MMFFSIPSFHSDVTREARYRSLRSLFVASHVLCIGHFLGVLPPRFLFVYNSVGDHSRRMLLDAVDAVDGFLVKLFPVINLSTI
jgi:hypothetical protein